VRTGDIVYSRRGDVERRALIRDTEDGWLCGTGCLRVRFDAEHVDSDYASYYLGDPRVREWIVRHAHGATMPNLNTAILSATPFVQPSLPKQRAIARVLAALDDKIDLNRRMSGTLEALARALFKSWLVDFDPIRGTADGRDLGLPKKLARLFPSAMEGSEIGDVPRGWEVRGLDSVARFVNGLALQKYPAMDGRALPVIKIAQLRAGSTVGADLASADIDPDFVVQDGDVLFSWSGSLMCTIWAGGTGALNQHLFKVNSTQHPKWLYYLWIQRHLADFRHIAAGKATTMGHIQRHHLSDAKVVVPPRELVEALDVILGPLLERSWRRLQESRTLAALRDTLLPRLISGKLRVPDAERFAVKGGA